MVRSAKKPVDDKAPKRPMSGYFLWTSDARAALTKKHPNKSITEIASMLGAEWGNMADAKKKPYQDKAEKLKAKYNTAMEKYKKSASYQKHQEALKEWKKTKANKPFPKDENRPKRAPSAYLLYTGDVRPALMKKGLAVTEVMSKASKMWNALSAGEKKKYEDKAAKAKAKYDKDIEKYEKSASHKKYIKEKAEYDAEMKAKRKADKSDSEGPAKKKVKTSASKSRSKSVKKAKK